MALDTLNSKYKSNPRLHTVDICRGLALLLMIEAHIPQSVDWVTKFSGIMAGPFFLIISGLSYDLFLSSRIKIESKKHFFLESAFRGLLVYAIPLIPYIIVGIFFMSNYSLVTGHKYELNIFHWGIFQVIGVGYIFGLLVPNNLKSKILIIVSTFIITYMINISSQETLYFLVALKPGSFPLFPWIAYFLFGRVAYELYQNLHLKKDTTLLSFSIVFLIINLLIFKISKLGFLSSTRDQFPMFLLISSIYLFIFSLLIIYVDHKHFYLRFMSPFEKVGKICFTAYYIHFLLLFVLEKYTSFFLKYFPSSISNLIILVVITIILVKIEENWRNYNYIFGFEWLIRKGTDNFLKLVHRFQIRSQIKSFDLD
jgi:hypothetical protein